MIETEYLGDGRWWENHFNIKNERHNEHGPAFIMYNADGSIHHEEYYLHGCAIRLDGPQYIQYSDGKVIYKSFRIFNEQQFTEEKYWEFIKSLESKENIEEYLFGEISFTHEGLDGSKTITHYNHGHIHKIDGPAIITYDKNGIITDEYYYLFGFIQLGHEEGQGKEVFEKMLRSVPREFLYNAVRTEGDCPHCRDIALKRNLEERTLVLNDYVDVKPRKRPRKQK